MFCQIHDPEASASKFLDEMILLLDVSIERVDEPASSLDNNTVA
jgi:hypothetical protein